MPLQKRDVGADGDKAAVACAPLVDLQPALVRKLDFARLRLVAVIRVGDPPLDHRPCCRRMHGYAFGAGHQDVVRKLVGLLEVGVAHDEAVVLVPEHEGLGGTFDGVGEPLVGLRIALRKTMLFRHVHGDADQMRPARGRADDLGAGP